MKIKLFYDCKNRQFNIPNADSNTTKWYLIGEMDDIASQKFVTYVIEKVSIGRRQEPLPDNLRTSPTIFQRMETNLLFESKDSSSTVTFQYV